MNTSLITDNKVFMNLILSYFSVITRGYPRECLTVLISFTIYNLIIRMDKPEVLTTSVHCGQGAVRAIRYNGNQ